MDLIKGLIFDKDGTLFDFNATWGAWAKNMLQAELGHDPDQMAGMAQALGFDLTKSVFHPSSPVIAGTSGEVIDLMLPFIVDTSRADLTGRMNTAVANAPQVEAVPLLPFFSRLKDMGMVVGVATNDAEAPARVHLASARIATHLDFVAGFDSGYGGKPAPGQLLAFCAATGLAPPQCAMVGDSLHDLQAGRAAGMTVIGVLTGPAPASELASYADVVLDNIGHIPAWLDQL